MRRVAWSCVVACLAVAACHAPPPEAPKPPDGERPWDEVVRGARTIDGYLPITVGADGTAYLAVGTKHLDRDFGLEIAISRGYGDGFVVQGMEILPNALVRLRRVGHKVYVVRRDPRPRSGTDETSARIAVDNGESIVAALPIVAERDGVALADASDWLLGDMGRVRDAIGATHGSPPDFGATVDRARSYVDTVRGFAKNDEIDVTLTIVPDKPVRPRPIAPVDHRAVTLALRYSIFALPETPMAARLADDRVGYFVQPFKDLTKLDVATAQPIAQLVNRWRLEKRDPKATLSPPVAPITFYLDASIPVAYRATVKEGVLAWNRAFEAAGFKDAIVVVDAPKELDYRDFRFSAIHWATAWTPEFGAYGPRQIDPRTGEILNADVIIMADMFTNFGRQVREVPRASCDAAALAPVHALVGDLVAAARPGALDPSALRHDFLRWIVMHEVGHTLGLRHNFRGSAAIPADKLADKTYTAVHGLSASVMDYLPLNVAPVGQAQGDYETPTLGDYDVLAIRYGYGTADDRIALGKLATAADAVGYGTDEDNWMGAWALDPKTAANDLGDDPIASAVYGVALLDEILPKLADTGVASGESYDLVRTRLVELTALRTQMLDSAIRAIGGVDQRHRHRGDDGPPLLPIAASEQRRALEVVLDLGLGTHAYKVPAELVPLLAPVRGTEVTRELEWTSRAPLDLPIHAMIAAAQNQLLKSLFAPQRLARIVDNTLRVPAGQAFTLAELFATATKWVFSELADRKLAVSAPRRNAQRAYVNRLLGLARVAEPAPAIPSAVFGDDGGPPPADPPPPADARALARAELVALRRRLAVASPIAADAETRAHFDDLSALIGRSLDAPPTTPAIANP